MGSDYSKRKTACQLLVCALTVAATVTAAVAVVGDAEFTAVEHQVEQIRGLTFKQPVPYEVLGRDQIVRNLTTEIDHDIQFPQYDAFLKAFGFVPPDYPTRARVLQLYGEQVGGYYDPHSKRFYLCKDAVQPSAGAEGALGAAMGISMEDVTIAHELTHALQDQYFDLTHLESQVDSGTEDEKLAVSALFEGDATAVMLEQPVRKLGLDPASLGDMSGLLEQSTLNSRQDFPAYSSAPLYFQRTLVFPYATGFHYVSTLRQHGGWDAVNNHYHRLPASTAEILDPDHSHPPVTVPLPQLHESGWTAWPRGTAGAYLTGVWLEQFGPDHPAAQSIRDWAGDSYQVYSRGQQWALVWATRWQDARAAGHFYDEVVRAVPTRHRGARYDRTRSTADRMVWLDGNGTCCSVERHDAGVLLLDGVSPDTLDKPLTQAPRAVMY